jgi:hypothetical protein
MCYYYVIIAKPPFTKPPFVNSRVGPVLKPQFSTAGSGKQAPGATIARQSEQSGGAFDLCIGSHKTTYRLLECAWKCCRQNDQDGVQVQH